MEVFDASVDGLGRAVAAPGAIEERGDIDGSALERGAAHCQLGDCLCGGFGTRVDHGA